jgi:hypothetical protein
VRHAPSRRVPGTVPPTRLELWWLAVSWPARPWLRASCPRDSPYDMAVRGVPRVSPRRSTIGARRLQRTCPRDSPWDMALSGAAARATCRTPRAALRSPDASPRSLRLASAGRRVPRDGARGGASGDLRRRSRPPAVRRVPERRTPPERLAAPCVLPDAEPLPPRRRVRARTVVARDALSELPLRAAVQRAARPRGASVPGAIRRACGRGRRALRERVRVRAEQPCCGGPLHGHRRLAVERRGDARRLTRTRARARERAPTSRAERTRRRGRSGAGSRARAPPASSCGSASSPRR